MNTQSARRRHTSARRSANSNRSQRNPPSCPPRVTQSPSPCAEPAHRQSWPSPPRISHLGPADPSSKSSPASRPGPSLPSDQDRCCSPPDRPSLSPPRLRPPASPALATLRSQSSCCSKDYAHTPHRAASAACGPPHQRKCNAPQQYPARALQSSRDTALETSRSPSPNPPPPSSSPPCESKSAHDIFEPMPRNPAASFSSTYKLNAAPQPHESADRPASASGICPCTRASLPPTYCPEPESR